MKTAFKQSGEPYIFGLNWKDTAQKQKNGIWLKTTTSISLYSDPTATDADTKLSQNLSKFFLLLLP